MEQAPCPRCGYDQIGVVRAWGNVERIEEVETGACCPLRGICSECGLELEWGALLNTQRQTTTWLFEHTRGLWRTLSASLGGGFRSLNGAAWWRRVRLEFAVRPRRLVLHWAVWSIVTHAGMGVIAGVYEAWGFWFQWQRYGSLYGGVSGAGAWTEAHTREMLRNAGRAALWPWPSAAFGYRPWSDSTLSLTALNAVILLITAAAFTAAGFSLLPATMRQVKVRRSHIVRGLGHAAPALCAGTLAWGLACALMSALVAAGSISYVDIGVLGVPDRVTVATLAALAWLGLWWWMFTRHYLHLPRAALVTLLLSLNGTLAAALLYQPATDALEWTAKWAGRLIDGLKWQIQDWL